MLTLLQSVMGYLYRMLTEAIAKWPMEELKSQGRNVRNYLQVDLEKHFPVDPATGRREPPADRKHEYARHLRDIQRLLNNDYLRQYPNGRYTTGHMGLTLDQLRQLNSEEGRRQLGIRRVDSRSIWRKWLFK